MPAARHRAPCVIRPSASHGRGAFATRTIRKGARIIEYRGARSSWKVACERPPSDPSDPYHTLLFELADGSVIDAGLRGNAARWINHGCDPNCEAIEYDDGHVFIHARRTIRRGEELTYDYRLAFVGPISRRARDALSCRCGAKRCRGTLLLDVPASRNPGARRR
ncbi:MAG: SET domain-containing protein [Casimicrobiaceae bacterium]